MRSKKAPRVLTTARLVLRKPEMEDAEAIFNRYASDRALLRYMAWPAHATVADTRSFLETSEREWRAWPAGPYVIASRSGGLLLGSTGLAFEAPDRASTGYVLAEDAWGKGYATEALRAMVALAADLGVERLSAFCHVDHRASARVLEKGGFAREGRRARHALFPNLGPEPQDVFLYSTRPAPDAPSTGPAQDR